MVEKSILRSDSLDFWAPIAFLGKVDFFEIAVINPFMNRFQKGLLIPRGHVNCEITHHSDIDISKFHSTLFCVIGFFGAHLKSPSFVRDFFHYFSRVADRLNSLWLDFQFFPTTLFFWDFWGSVGTFVFLVLFPTLGVRFVLTPTTDRYAQPTQSAFGWCDPPSSTFFLWHLEAGGARRPPRPAIWYCSSNLFKPLNRCSHYPPESVIAFWNFSKIKKFFRKKKKIKKKNKIKIGQKFIFILLLFFLFFLYGGLGV